jgi:malonyl CoA-acyl carrier protein transacylase
MYNAGFFFTAELFNLEEEIVVAGTVNQVVKPDQVSKRISEVELEIANLKVDMYC